MAEKRATRRRHRHDPSKSLVGCIVGDVHYAFPIARVKEIANALEVVPLPHAPPEVVGVADYRGEVVPVIDLRTRFGLPVAESTRKSKWIVVDVAGRPAALIVDAVTDVFGTGGAGLRPGHRRPRPRRRRPPPAPAARGGRRPPRHRWRDQPRGRSGLRPRHGAPA